MSNRLKRLASLIAALTLVVTVAPAAAGAQSDGSTENAEAVTRLWGQNRFATSLAVAEVVAADAGGELSTAVVVSGHEWTDAVTAAPLAGSLGAPVLLADPRHGVTAATRAFMERVGVTRIVVIGSAKSLPDDALSDLSGIDSGIERVTAADRHAASVAVARKISTPAPLSSDYGQTVILASGKVFADALSAGPLGAFKGIPILLTPPDELHPSVSDYIAANADHVIIMGGSAAISDAVEQELRDENGLNKDITRVGGKDRFETATQFADFIEGAAAEDGCFDGTVAGLATGGTPADAYSAAPLLARLCAPLVLTFTHLLPDATKTWLSVSNTERLYVFGGTAAVSDAAVSQWMPRTAVQAQFRRWDHQALIDLPLWSHCPPEMNRSQELIDLIAKYDRTWANWDTVSYRAGGLNIAAGWWTDEQLAMWIPDGSVTAESARRHATYYADPDTIALWPDHESPRVHWQGTPRVLATLRAAMEHRGLQLESFARMLTDTRDGIAGTPGPWPETIDVGKLLTSWTRWRYAQPPTYQEPVAWPLWSLFTARESDCAGAALIAMCDSGETPSPMLARDHPIGRVLRSLACGE